MMLDDPKISVLLCTNKIDEYFYQAIESVLSQSFEDFELIIILNGKMLPPDTRKILQDKIVDQRVMIIQTMVEGLTFSLNLGLHHSKAPIVARMDADDISYHDRFEIQYRFLLKNQNVMLCGSNYDFIDGNSRVLRSSNLYLDNSHIRKKLYWSNPICHPTVMFRKDYALSVGGYSGDKAEDYDLWLRMMSFTDKAFVNLPMRLLAYRTSGLSQARGAKLAYITMALSQMKMFFLTYNAKWILSMLVSIGKIFIRSRKL